MRMSFDVDGEKLRQLRVKKALSLRALGERTGVAFDTISKLNKALADRDDGLFFDVENLTVSEYLDRWLRDSAQGSVRASTYKSYGQQVRRYLKPSLGQMKLRKLSPMHVQWLYREMQDRGLSARTVQYAHVVLHRALEQATRWGMVGRNVAED